MLPITLPACWCPPLTFLCGCCCVCRVTVTWSYQERVGRLVTKLSLLPHPVLGIGCRRLETLVFDCFIQEQTEELSISCCLHWEHCVNSGMCQRSDCRGRTTSHCCYCYRVCMCQRSACRGRTTSHCCYCYRVCIQFFTNKTNHTVF